MKPYWTAGLDQLGPTHARQDTSDFRGRPGGKRGLRQRVNMSEGRRKPSHTFPTALTPLKGEQELWDRENLLDDDFEECFGDYGC